MKHKFVFEWIDIFSRIIIIVYYRSDFVHFCFENSTNCLDYSFYRYMSVCLSELCFENVYSGQLCLLAGLIFF